MGVAKGFSRSAGPGKKSLGSNKTTASVTIALERRFWFHVDRLGIRAASKLDAAQNGLAGLQASAYPKLMWRT